MRARPDARSSSPRPWARCAFSAWRPRASARGSDLLNGLTHQGPTHRFTGLKDGLFTLTSATAGPLGQQSGPGARGREERGAST